jgi:DNA repair protein RadC
MATLNSTITTRQAREDQAIYRAMHLLENRLRKPGEAFNNPKTVRQYLALHLAEYEREVFSALWLDSQHCLIAAEHLFIGTLTQTSVYPREVMKRALHHNAAAVILAHNHPSGVAKPSQSDRMLTDTLKQTLALVDVRILDHFIVAGSNVLSFAEHGFL